MTTANGQRSRLTRQHLKNEELAKATPNGGNLGIMRRDAAETLVLEALPVRKTSARTPGPGPMLNMSWALSKNASFWGNVKYVKCL